jgi:alpha-maltose-1-phosphate synthase
MKVLLLYDYPPPPGGLATQADLLYQGLLELGIEVYPVHFEAAAEKEWYYRWFKPDIVVGIGYWGHTPQLVLHPQQYGLQPLPWLVADGYMANYQEVLNALPLILVTSNWVKEVYVRDGINGDTIEVLPVGCNTDVFRPYERNNEKILSVRQALGITSDQLMILTMGGDAASKGAQEVMHALAMINHKVPPWKYICKVWPQSRTTRQNLVDRQVAAQLGIKRNVTLISGIISRNFVPYLIGACDIYAGPSRLEGFGMAQVEAGACAKPVIGIKAMGMLDTLVDGETAFLANIAQEILLNEAILGSESGFAKKHKVVFLSPRTAEFRASVDDIANSLLALMNDPALREKMGKAGRAYVEKQFDYRVVAARFVQIIAERLGIE